MADRKKRLPTNVGGDFFVDSTCINCDTCRRLAPMIFADTGEYSSVQAQPGNEDELRLATRALLACPTGSIGTTGRNISREVIADFPLELEPGVFYCGFNSEKSFGGNSYFVTHPEGNWLIDSPRYLSHLVKRFRELGGIQNIFLTHRDDVADAHLYAKEFGARRIIHRQELVSQPGAEFVLDGNDPVHFGKEFVAVPTIGHTAGHCILHYRRRYLFTGDHIWWSRNRNGLAASEDYCWFSWEEQVRSLKTLQSLEFEWILPGHGDQVKLPQDEMQKELRKLLRRIG
jgi:glyoxylase-like metal-dependent hydrolase (beta-lactamase superfamily II)/ferredoxin